MLAPSAFSALAPFATEFSGNGVDMLSENYDVIGNITGYASEKYDELIDKAYKAENSKDRTALLHDAEKMLLEDMPVIPVVFQQDAFLVGDALSGVKSTYWGRNFKDTKMKNYMEYKESIQAVLNENEAEVAE